ncbi:hypothetical protein BWI93_10270 [Siphonobacter sp. BAB-5385]|uniref:TIR domain-containing protein n=1 Tax=Siphonobacter sp. BAB-5385 TaxID=1864822 RepID=UPI000B9E5C23|nr:TIR domain-containing protein [Siphonobacter sp. BAB-5385]OZI08243.1 hypothetical protein BWI93_10270 [Siphonobacter sp. BAB-5385]
MKVFISWSGERSRQVAELLDSWLQCVIQAVDPWVSTHGINSGSVWFLDILNKLSETSVGIICLTKENLNKPWILFEAGAIAKGLQASRVCVLLVDIKDSDVRDPLAQFNNTKPTKDGLLHLVSTINSTLGDKSIKEKVLTQVFNTYWDQFEKDFKAIIASTTEAKLEETSPQDILPDVYTILKNMEKRMFFLERATNRDRNPGNEQINEMLQHTSIRNRELEERLNLMIKENEMLRNALVKQERLNISQNK